MGAPQIIYIAWQALICVVAGYMHGKPREGTYNVGEKMLVAILQLGLLYWGGFFK